MQSELIFYFLSHKKYHNETTRMSGQFAKIALSYQKMFEIVKIFVLNLHHGYKEAWWDDEVLFWKTRTGCFT